MGEFRAVDVFALHLHFLTRFFPCLSRLYSHAATMSVDSLAQRSGFARSPVKNVNGFVTSSLTRCEVSNRRARVFELISRGGASTRWMRLC